MLHFQLLSSIQVSALIIILYQKGGLKTRSRWFRGRCIAQYTRVPMTKGGTNEVEDATFKIYSRRSRDPKRFPLRERDFGILDGVIVLTSNLP